MNNILLSICIPTNGRIEILKNTLDSIFNHVTDFSEFEVILSDNSKTNELPELLKQYSDIPNIIYQKTEVSGFMNSINALKLGSGELLKLHNNYTELKVGSLDRILDTIKKHQVKQPLLFFSNHSMKNITSEEFASFNKFMYSLSYFSSWSTGFCIWNTDFQHLKSIQYNKMFPHTSLLFEQTNKNSYIINNEDLFYNQNTRQKGGYDLFKTFAVDFLDMLDVCLKKNHITQRTFKHIKFDMHMNFLIFWYYNTKVLKNEYTFILSDIKQSMKVYYSGPSYYIMIFLAYKLYLVQFIKKAIRKTITYLK